MFGNQNKIQLALCSGALGMLVGIVGLLLFQMTTSAQQAEKPVVQQEPSVAKHSPFSDSFFSDTPFESMRRMQEQMFKDFNSFDSSGDSFFDSKRSRLGLFGDNQKSYTMKTEETKNSLIYEVQLENNVEGDSVNVAVENGMVTISGQKTIKSQDEGNMGQSFFSSSSSFSQSFSVPDYVDSEDVKITNKDNKIILTFPKRSQEV